MKPFDEADQYTHHWDFAFALPNKKNPMDKISVKGS